MSGRNARRSWLRAASAPGPPRVDDARRLAMRREAQVIRRLPATIPARPSRHRSAGAGRSRCRARSGSTHSAPRAPIRKRSSICALSSSLRPATCVERSAARCETCKPRDELGEMKCVRADIADSAGDAGLLRVRAPSGLFLTFGFERVVSQSCAYSTCTTRSSPSSPAAIISLRLSHERIAAVVVGDCENAPRTFRRCSTRSAASATCRQRLVADDVESRASRQCRAAA